MLKEKVGSRPKDWLRRDPLIREMHRHGYSSYLPGYRRKDLIISPSPRVDWTIIVSKDTPKERVPWEVSFKAMLKESDLTQEKLGISKVVLMQRAKAWIAGYGVKALEEGDLITSLMALNEISPKALKENRLLTYFVSKIIHGFLGLPKS